MCTCTVQPYTKCTVLSTKTQTKLLAVVIAVGLPAVARDVLRAIDEVGASLQGKMMALHAFKGQEEIAKAARAESNRLNKIAKPNEDDDD